MGRGLLPLALSCLVFVSCCGEPDRTAPKPDVSAEVDTERFGLFVLTYTENSTRLKRGDQLSALGWFAEYSGATREEALARLNAPMPGEASSPSELDTCEFSEQDLPVEANGEGLGSGWIYLMDGGEVTVEAGTQAHELDSAYFPDVGPDVSGLYYDGVFDSARILMHEPTFELIGHGGSQVGSFRVAIAPPEPLQVTSIAGLPAWATVVNIGPVPGDLESLPVRWLPPRRRNRVKGEQEVLHLEVVRRGFSKVASVSCAVRDDGSFDVPGALLAKLPQLGSDQTTHLEAARVREANFRADGLDAGRVVVIARESVLLR